MKDPYTSTSAGMTDRKTVFGFWLFLMTDFVLFAALFATYAVLHGNTFGGPGGVDVFNMPLALWETLVLLVSSFTCGLALLAARDENASGVLWLLGATFILGVAFVGTELTEFVHLILANDGPSRSAFFSSYFTLVGTHGLHVTIGLVWMAILMAAIARRGLSRGNMRKLALISFFWHFLDIIWIFIFTIVYLFGVM